MLVTHKAEMDILTPGETPRLFVKQGDALSRWVEIALYADGAEWTIPEGAATVIRYCVHSLEDGEEGSGIYDTLPDGQAAWEVSGNLIRFVPVPEMFARHGIVQTDIVFLVGEETIATCNLEFYVNPAPNGGTEAAAVDYYRFSSLEQINSALDGLLADMEYALHQIRYIQLQMGMEPAE